MRVLVSTTAGPGHFGPVVPYAQAFAAGGHEVLVAAPASFADAVASAGLEHRPFADAPAELLGPVFGRMASLTFEEANATVVADVFGRLDARSALPGVAATIDEWGPDVVLREPAELGSLVAARAAGVPQMTVAIGMSAMARYLVGLLDAPLRELDALVGLPGGSSAAAMRTAPTLTCVPAALDRADGTADGTADGIADGIADGTGDGIADGTGAGTGPDADRDAGPVHRFRDPAAAAVAGTLPDPWGDPSLPLVYVSFGSVAAGLDEFARLYPAVLVAFADQPVRVLLTTGAGVDPADLGPVPPNARVERWWPQSDVMPHAAAVVGHGGFGTTMAALAAGVPQVVLPLFSTDQRINAVHVEAAGAGLQVTGGPAAVASLPDAVRRLLAGPAHRDAARAVARDMAALPPVADAVRLVQRAVLG